MDGASNSAFEMASLSSKLSYQRLRKEGEFENDEEERAFRNIIRKWSSFKKFKYFRKRRPKLKIPVLRKLLRKRSKLFSRFKVSWNKALKRLKNGQVHINDLFGGNYLFMQANPSLRCGDQRQNRPSMVQGHQYRIGLPSSRYSLTKIA